MLIEFGKSTLIILLCALTFACKIGGDPSGNPAPVNFKHEGLDGREIIRLYQHDNRYFAATSAGLYAKQPSADQWQSLGLDQLHVFDIAFLNDDHYIVSVRSAEAGVFSDHLLESTDSGQNWQPIEHNFGGEDPETIFGFYYDSDNAALYATGRDALAVSYDDGYGWVLLNGGWGGFAQPKHIVEGNPVTNEIWYGGQNAIEQMVLVRYNVDSEAVQAFQDLLPSPSVIYGIRFEPQVDTVVYVSGEGGVIKSQNNGDTWATLIGDVDHRFYFDIALDPADSQTLYTGGWTKNWETPQPLIFEISNDAGKTWKKYRHPSNTLFGGVRSILAVTEASATVVYLGLYGGGIMKATFP